MTPEELSAAYAASAQPYIDCPGPVPLTALAQKSWRYVFEVSSMCNLKCALCHAGNREGYEYEAGVMDMGLMEACLDKIQYENPNAIVCCYVNSDPFLHKRLPEVISAIRRRGLNCEVATNANFISNLDQVLAAKPNQLTMSVSGWTQEIYERAHRGGNVEVVKENIKEIAEARKRGNHYDVLCGVSYHMYNDNTGDDQMGEFRRFTEALGLLFMVSWGRVITIENTVQALRELERRRNGTVRPYSDDGSGQDMNEMLPPAKPEFIEAMKRLKFHPEKAAAFYSRWPVSPVCLISEVFTEIRWNGQVQLCAWTDDMRLTLGNYLEMTPQQIAEKRRGRSICQECLRYRLNYYFHITDCTKWDSMDLYNPENLNPLNT